MVESTGLAHSGISQQTRAWIENTLPEDIWDRILNFVRDDSWYQLHKFAAIIPVNKAWADLAQPKLYNFINFEDLFHKDNRDPGEMLTKLATALLDVPHDHPKRTWIRQIRVEMRSELDAFGTMMAFAAELYVERESSYILQTGSLAVLAESSRTTLVTLKILIGLSTLSSLRIIPGLINLRTLSLQFDSDVRSIDPLEYPPLCMPTILDFEAGAYSGPPDCRGMMDYLASSRFASRCRLSFSFSATPQLARLLDPIFLAHDSRSITLDFGSQFVHPTVLHRTQHLYLNSLPSPSLFRDIDVLPSIVKLRLDGNHSDRLFDIMDAPATSKATFNTCLHIRANGIIFGSTTSLWHWHWVPEGAVTEFDMRMTIRLLQFSRLLKPRGITLADYHGFIMDLPSIPDPRLVEGNY